MSSFYQKFEEYFANWFFQPQKIERTFDGEEAFLKDNMNLYDISYFQNNYKKIKYEKGEIKLTDLYQIDYMHYLGHEPIDKGAEYFGLKESNEFKKILDVGCGLGGPSRYLASTYENAKVVGVEIQSDFVDVAKMLNSKFGLDEKVEIVLGNILEFDSKEEYDNAMSILAILHIDDKKKCYEKIFESLKKGGRIFIEDFFIRKSLSLEDLDLLSESVSCTVLQTKDDYVKVLKNAGFTDIEFVEMNDRWFEFIENRMNIFTSNEKNLLKYHSKVVYESVKSFYVDVWKLFNRGNLGGCRIYAKK